MTVSEEVRDELTYLFLWHHRLDTRGDGQLLLEWLLGPYSETPHRLSKPWEVAIESEMLPDLCCICGGDFGLTPAGRIRRDGCPVCKGEGNGELLFAWRRHTGANLYTLSFLRLAKKYRRLEYGHG